MIDGINIGTRLITRIMGPITSGEFKGEIVDIQELSKGKFDIVIKWFYSGKLVRYTESMFDECLLLGKIKIDKQFHREEKLKELGI